MHGCVLLALHGITASARAVGYALARFAHHEAGRSAGRALMPNPSLKRSANGRPPGPVWRYAVHFRQPGPGVLPLAPALLDQTAQPSEHLAEVLSAEAAARNGRPKAKVQDIFGLAAFKGSALVGWAQGYRVGPSQFHMLNSGVDAAERRTGVYSQLILAVLAHAESQG